MSIYDPRMKSLVAVGLLTVLVVAAVIHGSSGMQYMHAKLYCGLSTRQPLNGRAVSVYKIFQLPNISCKPRYTIL